MGIKPGTDNMEPGIYIEVGANDEIVENAREITIDMGDRLPPTQHSGHTWIKKN